MRKTRNDVREQLPCSRIYPADHKFPVCQRVPAALPPQRENGEYDVVAEQCRALAASQVGTKKKRKFRFQNPLLSLDATVIDLCASMFDWAKFRLTNGAV